MRALLAVALAWGALVAWRFEVLALPPYYETAMGLFREADYLAETGFDYQKLRNEPDGNEGGPHVYMTSILPTLLALLMLASPSPTVTALVAHAFSFAAAATLAVLLAWLVGRRSDAWFGAAVAAAAITTPLAITQVELIGIDVPMTACALAAVAAVSVGRFRLAAVACLAAFFMKPTGLIASVAIISYLAIAWLVDRLTGVDAGARRATPQPRPPATTTAAKNDAGARAPRRALFSGLIWNVVAMALAIGIYTWGGIHSRLMRVSFTGSWIAHAWRVCPDLLVLAGLALVLCVGVAIYAAVVARRSKAGWRVALGEFLTRNSVLYLSALIVIGDLAAMRLYAGVFVIRYVLLGVPFLYLLLAAIVYRPSWGRWNLLLPVALVALNVYNADGRLFPDAGGHARHCAPLERSREYLADHRSHIAAMHYLAAQAGDTPILAGYPFNYYLAFPRMGYVAAPRSGYAAMPLLGTRFRSVYDLYRDQPRQLVIISVDNPSHRIGSVYTPPPAPGDRIVYDDHQPSPLLIYEKNLAPLAAQPGGLEAWYLENLWGGGIDRLPSRVWQMRAEELVAVGRADLAVRLLEQRVAAAADDSASRVQLAQLYMAAGRTAEVQQLARQLISSDQARREAPSLLAHAHLLLGLTLIQGRRLDAARSELNAALGFDPSVVEARVNLGVCDLLGGNLAGAERQFQAVLAEQPDHVGALYHLGLIWAAQGRVAEAEHAFERVAAADPRHFDARQQLAERRRQARRFAEALEYYRQGVELRPDWLDGLNAMAWIMATSPDPSLSDGPRALDIAQRVCEISGFANSTALDTLAAAYAECGQFDRAVEFAEKALAAIPPDQQAASGAAIRLRLEKYRRREAYRDI
ncbi:MAG: tetratricopeptide repeat protein [Pirellulales bacterium]